MGADKLLCSALDALPTVAGVLVTANLRRRGRRKHGGWSGWQFGDSARAGGALVEVDGAAGFKADRSSNDGAEDACANIDGGPGSIEQASQHSMLSHLHRVFASYDELQIGGRAVRVRVAVDD